MTGRCSCGLHLLTLTGGILVCPRCDADALTMWRLNHA